MRFPNSFFNNLSIIIQHRKDIPDEFWQDEDFRKILWFDMNDNKGFGITRLSGHIVLARRLQRKIFVSWNRQFTIDYQYPSLDFFRRFNTSFLNKAFSNEVQRQVDDFALLFKIDLDPNEVLTVRNTELRRCLIKQIGYDKLKDSNSYLLIDHVGYYDLFEFEGMRFLKMKDSSHDIEYVLSIPFSDNDIVGTASNGIPIKTVRHALAWSFSIHPLSYDPQYET